MGQSTETLIRASTGTYMLEKLAEQRVPTPGAPVEALEPAHHLGVEGIGTEPAVDERQQAG